MSESGTVRLAAMGDLMLNGEWEVAAPGEAFGALASALSGCLVFANLETSLLGSEGVIEKEPRVFASESTVEGALRTLGVGVVTRANNHSFDGNLDGFRRASALLERLGVSHFGAGVNAEEAARPLIHESGSVRLGWLGFVSPGTEPPQVASRSGYGVNPLEHERCRKAITELKEKVDHVVVSIHWGVEFCHLPSPDQVAAARSFIDAGATLVLGHHAHVIQGVECYKDGLIAYNLGNATTADHRIGTRLAIRQTRRTRSSLVLCVELTKKTILNHQIIPIRSHEGKVLVHDEFAKMCLLKANRYLKKGVSARLWRRRRIFEDVVLRTVAKLHPTVIRSVGPRHFGKWFRNLVYAAWGRSRY